jgi:hypothetical protein
MPADVLLYGGLLTALSGAVALVLAVREHHRGHVDRLRAQAELQEAQGYAELAKRQEALERKLSETLASQALRGRR